MATVNSQAAGVNGRPGARGVCHVAVCALRLFYEQVLGWDEHQFFIPKRRTVGFLANRCKQQALGPCRAWSQTGLNPMH